MSSCVRVTPTDAASMRPNSHDMPVCDVSDSECVVIDRVPPLLAHSSSANSRTSIPLVRRDIIG